MSTYMVSTYVVVGNHDSLLNVCIIYYAKIKATVILTFPLSGGFKFLVTSPNYIDHDMRAIQEELEEQKIKNVNIKKISKRLDE